ncbi:MAG: hypothetical protein [Wendovervirus sonii]|uniref:Uncharacterized protein n=1 Tax=phage Lak_Megaphage_Sonny TaxID=3109229 RepID=A0ABZ0Z589_9CAUD|nr:MAG: hypothetical protein [phage Lak_Megaphage_Sonny]
MKNLYKKIYEAINTGIQKALVLDNEDDISMNYQHSKIVNNKNLLPYYVDDLLQDSDIEYNYGQIIKYYKETGYKYKVKDFNELRNIFDKIKNFKNVSWEWLDMKDYVSIVLEDRSEINFYEETDKKSLFLKFANDNILGTENEILIYLHDNHYVTNKDYKWQTTQQQIQDDEHLINMKKYGNWENAEKVANKDFSGYENCLRIHDIASKDPDTYGKIPAINYCLNLNDIEGYQGYLPSMGQLRIIYDNVDLINYILNYLNKTNLYIGRSWSSTEYVYCRSWIIHYNSTETENKTYGIVRVFPLFKYMKN